jgi:leader peptidase (prepilin peptidase) / N-methyltransferase
MVGGLRRALADYRKRVLGRPRLAIVMGAVLVVVEGALVWRLGVHAQLAPYLCFGLVGAVLAEYDLSTRRIPNRIVLPSIVLELALFAVASDVDRHWHLLARAIIGGALFATFLLVLDLAYRHQGGVGGGDVKAAALIGLALGWIGWPFVFTGVVLAFLLQLSVVQVLRMSHRLRRGEAVPMAPFLFAGAVVAILLS